MNDIFEVRVVERFEDIIKRPIQSYLEIYDDFLQRDQQNILNYFGGILSTPITASFEQLSSLLDEANEISNSIELFRGQLADIELLLLCDVLDDARIQLQTLQNGAKWLRSSINQGFYSLKPKVDKIMPQLNSLEDMANSEGATDPDFDWIQIALDNDLIEEDYTSQGGINVAVSGENNNGFSLQSVVGSPQGEEVYGRDIYRCIEFVEEEGDIKSLLPLPTFVQSCEILLNLKKGQNKEFPSHGISSSVVAGTTRNTVNYPSLFRQLFSTFQRDDTIKSIEIIDLDIDADSLKVTVNIQSQLNTITTITTEL